MVETIIWKMAKDDSFLVSVYSLWCHSCDKVT